MRTLLLIDANSIIHRSFHALPPFTAPDGSPSGAIYGVASILLKLWREGRPDYAAALFDRPEPTFREKKYAEYKAQRPPAPNELISQLIETHNLFSAFGIKTFEIPGYEADDLIATLAEKFRGSTGLTTSGSAVPAAGGVEDLKIIILTGDKDTLQLVHDPDIAVRIFKTGVSETTTYDEAAVREKYGLVPGQLVDYKALVGDASDNVKGVPGVGPKTAAEWLQRFGSLENIYKNIAGDEKLEHRLGPFRKEAELSKELVVLDREAPVELGGLEELGLGAAEEKEGAVQHYFKKPGFETLLKRLNGDASPVVKKPKKGPDNKKPQQSLL